MRGATAHPSLPRSASAPTGTLSGLSRVQCRPRDRGGDPTAPSPMKPSVVQSVDALLAGSAFNPQTVFDRYWMGEWTPTEARTSLFGPLTGPALRAAIVQLLQVGQERLQDQHRELAAFKQLLEPLLAEVEGGADDAPGPPVDTPPGPAPLDVRRVINTLYNRREGEDATEVLALFGGLTGPALLAALDEVTAGLNDANLNIGEDDRDRVRADIDTLRRHVLLPDMDEMDDEEEVEVETGLLPARVPAEPLTTQQARRVVHALLDHSEGEDLAKVWALFGSLVGLDLLRALDQVAVALHDETWANLISETNRDRIDTCIEVMRHSVDVPEEDRLLAALLRAAHPGGHQASAPPDAWALIDRLRKGKFGEGDNAALIELFGGRTGPELLELLDGMERVLREDALSGEATRLPEDEREAVWVCLASIRRSLLDETGDAPHQPRGLTKNPRLFDLKLGAFRGALAQGGVTALQRLLAHLNPPQQWLVLSTLVEDPALLSLYPALLAMEQDAYRHRIALRRGDQPLERVRNWYRRSSTKTYASPVPPAVPEGIEVEAWIRELRILLYQLYPEPSRKRAELSRALERYQHALGVKTDREHAEALWLDSVRAALAASTSGHALLQGLGHRLGLDANVALALMTALAESKSFDEDQQVLIRRAAAILMAKHDHSLLCIALPYHKARTPQRLNILYPREPKPDASADIRNHHQKLVDSWHKHAPLVDHDIHKVQGWLLNPPATKSGPDGQAVALTPGEQCDHLLCAMELPPKRVELALLKIAQSCSGTDDRDKYLLARRLLSELVYSERNDAGHIQRMGPLGILLRLLGVVVNGVREGGAHGLAMFAVRVGAHYMGGWAFVVLGVLSVGQSFWAQHHLEHAKSPDYQLNPSPILGRLIRVVPPLNTVCLSGLMLGTGLLPVMKGIGLPFDVSEALYYMNAMRALRQVMQSGTQPLARLFRLTDARGAGLPAQLSFFVNVVRDALYMGGSAGFLFFLGRQLDEQMNQWGPPRSSGDALMRLLIKTVPSTLNEMADGMNPDIAILLARLVSWLKGPLGLGDDDFLLQPNVPMQLAAVPAHMADHIAGRSDIVGLQDPFNAASALATHLEQPELALFFKWVAVVLNGFLGALRGRELSYLRTTDPRASAMAPRDGFNPRNPDGLLVALAYLASALGSQVRQAVFRVGLLPAPPPQVTTEMPPLVWETRRQRTQTLLLSSSKARDLPPDTQRTNTDIESADGEGDGSEALVDLDGTPPLPNPIPRRSDGVDDA